MLSLFDSLEDTSFALWVKDDGNELHLLISDGQNIWQPPRPISGNDKPASRRHESDELFLSQLKKALKSDPRSLQGNYELEIKSLEPDVQLVVKETIGTTTTKSILFKCTLERSNDTKMGFMAMFTQAAEKIKKDGQEIITLNKSIDEYTALVETLSNDTKDMTIMKEKLHDELISKFCIVLNTKKREIERLNERIEELESQRSAQQHLQVVDLTAAPVPAKGKAAPRGRAAAAAAKTTTMECVTGTKRKAPAKAATTTAKRKAAPTRTSRRPAESDEEEQEEDNDKEDEDEGELEDSESEDASTSDAGSESADNDNYAGHSQSDVEITVREVEAAVPTVTQSSVPNAASTPATARNRASSRQTSGTNKNAVNVDSTPGGSSSAKAAVAAPAVTTVTQSADPATSLLQRVAEEEESEEEALHSRPRLVKAVTKEAPTPFLTAKSAATQASAASVAPPLTLSQQSTGTGTGVVVNKSGKSKFYAEDSDDGGDCLDYM